MVWQKSVLGTVQNYWFGVVLFGKSARKKHIPPLGDSVKNGYHPQGEGRFSGQQGRIAQNRRGESPERSILPYSVFFFVHVKN